MIATSMVIEDRGGKSGGGAAKAVGLTSGGLRCVPASNRVSNPISGSEVGSERGSAFAPIKDGWIIRRLWSHRTKRWRNAAWREYPTKRLRTEFKLVSLVALIPSLQIAKALS